jgi:hypothetical protein
MWRITLASKLTPQWTVLYSQKMTAQARSHKKEHQDKRAPDSSTSRTLLLEVRQPRLDKFDLFLVDLRNLGRLACAVDETVLVPVVDGTLREPSISLREAWFLNIRTYLG